MMMTTVIRRAQQQDLDPLCQLVHAFHEFHVVGVPLRLASLGNLSAFDCRDLLGRLAQIIVEADAAVFVAAENDQLVGFAEIYLREDDPNPATISRKYGYLQSLMVHEGHRSKGIGMQLLTEAEQWAQARGAEEIRLEIWEFTAGPLKFYENFGYRTLKRTMSKDICYKLS